MASTLKVDQLEGSTGSTVTIPTGQSLVMTDGLTHASLPTVQVAKGGTNLTSFTAGDLLYATGSTTLAKLAKGTTVQTLKMNAGATAPEWVTVGAASLQTNVQRKPADYTIVTGDCASQAHLVIPISAAAADRTITLPAVGAAGVATCKITVVCEAASGAAYEVKVVDASATELWSGVEKGDFVTLIVSNSAWVVLDHKETYYEHRYLTSNQSFASGVFGKWAASTSMVSIGNCWDAGNSRFVVPFDCYLYIHMNIYAGTTDEPSFTGAFKLGAISSEVTMFQNARTNSDGRVSGPTPYIGCHRATVAHVAEPWLQHNDTGNAHDLEGGGASASQFTFRAIRRYSQEKLMAIYFKPIDVPDNSFTTGLKGVSTDAFSGYTESNGTGLFVEWNDDIATFPSSDVINAHADKASWERVREKRNELLAETDYLALSDNTLSAEMTTYRQELRDITEDEIIYDFKTGKPTSGTLASADVVYPTKPAS